MHQKGFSQILISVGIVVIIGVGIGGYYLGQRSFTPTKIFPAPTGVACTLEAKVCPDGSSVGRSGPNCEFTACLNTHISSTSIVDETINWKTYNETEEKIYNGTEDIKYEAFSFKYPLDISFEVGPHGIITMDNQMNFYTSDSNPENCRGDCSSINKVEDVLVNNIPARRIFGTHGCIGGNTPQSFEQVVIPYKGSFYIFSINELKLDQSGGGCNPPRTPGQIPLEKLNLFNKIFSTFKFL